MSIQKRLARLLLVLIGVLLIAEVTLVASDVNALSKKINKDLRQAERMIYGGKKTEADLLLIRTSQMIDEVKATDASNSKVKSLEKKYVKLRKMLDKRMKKSTVPASVSKTTGSKTTAVTSKNSTPNSGSSKAADKLANNIDMALKKAERMIRAKKEDRAKPYLTQASEMIEELKIADASHKKLANLEQRYSVMASSGAEKEKNSAEMDQDAVLIISMYDKYYAKLEPVHGDTLVYKMEVDSANQALELIEKAEKTLPLFSVEIEKLSKKYGTNATDIYNTFWKAGYKLNNSEDHKMEKMLAAKGNVQGSREASANTIVINAETLLRVFSEQFNDARLERMKQARQLLFVGERIDPQNKKLQEMLVKVDDQIVQAADKMEEQINAATWAGNVTQFDGPGNVKDLAAKAKVYFENDRDWGKRPGKKNEILDVCVTGQWKAAEKDAFGRVIRWRLPIHVAVTDENFRPRNIARIYDLSIVMMQGSPGSAPKKPPFDGFWVGDNWMMRLDKLE